LHFADAGNFENGMQKKESFKKQIALITFFTRQYRMHAQASAAAQVTYHLEKAPAAGKIITGPAPRRSLGILCSLDFVHLGFFSLEEFFGMELFCRKTCILWSTTNNFQLRKREGNCELLT
jgi:hypothetical protein